MSRIIMKTEWSGQTSHKISDDAGDVPISMATSECMRSYKGNDFLIVKAKLCVNVASLCIDHYIYIHAYPMR